MLQLARYPQYLVYVCKPGALTLELQMALLTGEMISLAPR